jgi:hypothetical protein
VRVELTTGNAKTSPTKRPALTAPSSPDLDTSAEQLAQLLDEVGEYSTEALETRRQGLTDELRLVETGREESTTSAVRGVKLQLRTAALRTELGVVGDRISEMLLIRASHDEVIKQARQDVELHATTLFDEVWAAGYERVEEALLAACSELSMIESARLALQDRHGVTLGDPLAHNLQDELSSAITRAIAARNR